MQQDQGNPVLWLSIQAGKKGLFPSCLCRISLSNPTQEKLYGVDLQWSGSKDSPTVCQMESKYMPS